MHDSSLACSRTNPNCNKFELVSPILRGGQGLGTVDRVMRTLSNMGDVSVNQTMGLHVHVNIADLTLAQLKKVCQNFCKYESVLDSMMPPSRRGSTNTYCGSNRHAVGGPYGTNASIHQAIASCNSIGELGELVSPQKYYKLNLRNIVENRQTTIEFRQHSGTYNNKKVKNWVRFCVAFVQNSARLRVPSHISSNANVDKLFEMMMMYVVKDRCLRDFYRQRRIELSGHSAGDCCEGCNAGGDCAADQRPLKTPRD